MLQHHIPYTVTVPYFGKSIKYISVNLKTYPIHNRSCLLYKYNILISVYVKHQISQGTLDVRRP